MNAQQKRRFTLTLNAYLRARTLALKWDQRNPKLNRRFAAAGEKLYRVADTLHDVDLRRCTCPAAYDHSAGHLPDCPCRTRQKGDRSHLPAALPPAHG
jgi:hypothetical protein